MDPAIHLVSESAGHGPWWGSLTYAAPQICLVAVAVAGTCVAATGAWSLVGVARSTAPDPAGFRGALMRVWLGAVIALGAIALVPDNPMSPFAFAAR